MATQPKKPKKVHRHLKNKADQKMRVIWRDMQGWLQSLTKQSVIH